MNDAQPLWTPAPEFTQKSNMAHFARWASERYELPSDSSYDQLWQWSVDHIADFWEALWQYFDIQSHSPYTSVLQRPKEGMIGTRWFEGATLNYAEHMFRHANEASPALLFQSERHALQEISWQELKDRVASLATWMRSVGVEKGDRVVSFLPNIPEALIAFLAANSLGAIWSSVSPDFGTASVVERFQQIEPKVLFVADGYSYNGKAYDKREAAREIILSLPTLEQVVVLPYLEASPEIDFLPKALLWEETRQAQAQLLFTPVPFDHPLWVLYSSGTTGKPKAITHSVGGCLLEHLKALVLHQDVKKGDRYFWYSTTGWMMWNYANAALLAGATVAIFDGAAGYPNIQALWDFAEKAQITQFGGGAAYYIACMKAELDFSASNKLPQLQSVGSTGSPLPPEAFDWLYQSVKQDLWVISFSGGTDVCSGFVGGSPYLPVYRGEIQCRLLGCKLEAFNESGEAVIGELGEMVITEPMPSMPIFFWNDPENARYHSSYFEMYPGIWRHGDWIKITERGGIIIYGRSDSTLNRGGVRIGTAEVYRGVESLEEIQDSLVICIEQEGGNYYMPLFVVLKEGEKLEEGLTKKIAKSLRSQFSPRHVPDEVFVIPEVPYTISGKKMETPVKKLLMGVPIEKAVSKDAMKNPDALAYFIEFAEKL
jgi:acetoacetyl-CoA synthetase